MTHDEAMSLITRLTTMDAAAERKFNADSRAMVRARTDALRRLVADNASVEELHAAVLDMQGWGCFGSLQAIKWLDAQMTRLETSLAPALTA